MPIQYDVYDEDEPDKNRVEEVSEEEAIKQMREVHNTSSTSNHRGKCSCSDEILLEDFITENWGWRV
jgi:hypothetical protein